MIRHYLFPVVGIILGFSACRSSETNEKQVLMVKTETVKNYENELQVTYPGRVKAAADVDLAFRVAGPIIRIPVQVGSFVRKGEVIAEIDPRDYELQYKATEAEYKQIKSEAERVIELYNRKSVPENDYDKAVYGLQQITSKLAAGMSVNVTIDYEAGGDNLTVVPLSAIFQDKEKSSVWVYRPADKKVTQRQVKIRQILKEGRVVLDEGLQSGEIVVTAGVHKLKEGMEVERLKPVADTNIGGLL